MQLAASILFYIHSSLCCAIGLYLATRTVGLVVRETATPIGSFDLDGMDDWVVQFSGYCIVALYLLFTEVYLYRIHAGI